MNNNCVILHDTYDQTLLVNDYNIAVKETNFTERI